MKREFKVQSSDKRHMLSGVVYLPCGEARGFFHIVHGMTEHIGRYERIMCELANEGYITFGYDNLGHGNTAEAGELGYIAKRGGDDFLARDVKLFSDAVINEYDSERKLPYYLMGHSMGSFITRLAIAKYVKPDKYICMGTGGKNAAAGAGLAIIALIKLFKGDKHISKFVDKLAFGSYNKRFGGGTKDDPTPWLTTDENMRKIYYSDRFCTFKFTISAMSDLIRMNKDSNKRAWYKSMPKDTPVLLLSGECDPVGNYGRSIREVEAKLKRCGADAKAIIYQGARHEILNDFTYDTVKRDILDFLGESYG